MAYDSQATRRRILQAASVEFAERGVAGARIDRIAETARANKRAIYDYFGDKNALFAAVLEDQLADCAQEVAFAGDDLPDYAGRLMDYHAAHPQALRLLLWEALELGDATVPAERARVAKYAVRVEAIARTGTYRADPRLLLLLTMGVVNWMSAVPQIRRMILGDPPPEQVRGWVVDAVEALTALGGGPGSSTAESDLTHGYRTGEPVDDQVHDPAGHR